MFCYSVADQPYEVSITFNCNRYATVKLKVLNLFFNKFYKYGIKVTETFLDTVTRLHNCYRFIKKSFTENFISCDISPYIYLI